MEEYREDRLRNQEIHDIPAVNHMERSENPISSMEMPNYSSPIITNTQYINTQQVEVDHHIDTSSSMCYHDCIGLAPFFLHLVIAGGAIGYLGFLAVKRTLHNNFDILFWYPKLAAAAGISALFSCVWQTLIRWFPKFMVRGVLYSSPAITFTASVMLVSASIPANVGVGVVLLALSIGQALYACWVTPRIEYAIAVLSKALEPGRDIIPRLCYPSYWTILIALLWTLVWCLGIVGAISNDYGTFMIIGLLVSFAWTMEVLRNVVNVTVSRVVALFYLRGMQSDVKFSFGRAINNYFGSVIKGSILIPLVEFFRVMARILNLVDQDDEFMFSCAHCCLAVMEFVFSFGNSWAFVQVGAYGKSFVTSSRDTWNLFQVREMEPVVDTDITSALCFLSGISGGSLCVIACGSWTLITDKSRTATVSVISFIVGYFLSRIGMVLVHASVCAWYVCYAENPSNRHFDNTIPERIKHYKTLAAISGV